MIDFSKINAKSCLRIIIKDHLVLCLIVQLKIFSAKTLTSNKEPILKERKNTTQKHTATQNKKN